MGLCRRFEGGLEAELFLSNAWKQENSSIRTTEQREIWAAVPSVTDGSRLPPFFKGGCLVHQLTVHSVACSASVLHLICCSKSYKIIWHLIDAYSET